MVSKGSYIPSIYSFDIATCKRYPIEDELLEQSKSDEDMKILQIPPDVCSFPGFPNRCIPDLLLSWDFLCTFSRSLSLDLIGLDDFIAALTYRPQVDNAQHFHQDEREELRDRTSEIPLFLAEVCMCAQDRARVIVNRHLTHSIIFF